MNEDVSIATASDPDIALALDSFAAIADVSTRSPARVYLDRLSEGSLPTMEGALRDIAQMVAPGSTIDTFPWWRLRYPHTQAIRARLIAGFRPKAKRQKQEAGFQPKTVNKYLSALRGVLEEAVVMGLMDVADGTMACKVRNVKIDKNAPLAGRALDDDEVRRLVAACDVTTPQGARDGAIIALLFGGGLRRGEVARSRYENLARNCVAITVLGKGKKTRTVPLPNDAALLVRAWLSHRGRDPGPLLASFWRGGEMRHRQEGLAQLSDSGVTGRVEAVAEAAGVDGFTCHDGRRTRITSMLLNGESIAIVQKIAGHEDVSTTAKYDRSGQDAMQSAAERVPMSGRSVGH